MKFNELKKLTEKINKIHQQLDGSKNPSRLLQDELDNLYAMLYPSFEHYCNDNDYFFVETKTLANEIKNYFNKHKIDCQVKPVTMFFKTKLIQISANNKTYQIGEDVNLGDKCKLNLNHMDDDLNQLVADYPDIYPVLWLVVKNKFINKYGDHRNPDVSLK